MKVLEKRPKVSHSVRLVPIDKLVPTPDTGTHGKAARPVGEDGKPAPLSMAEKRARLQKRRDAFVVQKVGETLRGLTPERLIATVAAMATRTDPAAKRFNPLALVLAFGTSSRADRDHDDGAWKRYEELLARSKDLPLVTAVHEVVQVWSRRLGGSDTHHVTEQATDARRICELLGLDANALDAEAAQAVPTPKSWEGTGDGTNPVKTAPVVRPTPNGTHHAARNGTVVANVRTRT